MSTPEVANAFHRQAREARERRERRELTVNRLRAARKHTPGLAPLGDPEELEREAMAGETARVVRRSRWLLVSAAAIGIAMPWFAWVSAGAPYGMKASAGISLIALSLFLMGALIAGTALAGLRTLGQLNRWSPTRISRWTRWSVWASSAATLGVCAVAVLLSVILVAA